jgi:cytochrome c-type biogenesis protein CcmE
MGIKNTLLGDTLIIQPRHRKYYRLGGIVLTVGIFAGAITLLLRTFEDAVVFYYTPQEVSAKDLPLHKKMRLGGLVEKGSLKRSISHDMPEPHMVFSVTDHHQKVIVHYQGVLPDLFKEGQGVVAEGMFKTKDIFVAKTLLSRHA